MTIGRLRAECFVRYIDTGALAPFGYMLISSIGTKVRERARRFKPRQDVSPTCTVEYDWQHGKASGP